MFPTFLYNILGRILPFVLFVWPHESSSSLDSGIGSRRAVESALLKIVYGFIVKVLALEITD